MISRRCLLALPGITLLADAERETEYLALDLIRGNHFGQWEQPDKAVSMGSLLKPFLVVAYARTHNKFPELLCRGAADHCWLLKGHGRQDVVSALANSCNFYFRHIAAELNAAALQSVCLSYGLGPPGAGITPDRLIGLGAGWPQRAGAVLAAFARLSRDASDRGTALALGGMQRSAERGTARGLGLKARAKTGTAPCSHTPQSEGDGYTAVLYPLDRVRLVLLARQCGTTGAHTAQLARPILQRFL
jgi:hypothetical protein